jgi:hypothetical protein
MPTLRELQNVSPLVEQAAAYILSSSFGYTNVYTTADDDVNAPFPRIEVSATRVGPTGHKFVSGSNSFYDHSYNVQMSVYVVSDRAETSASQHKLIAGNVGIALGDNTNYISASSMPYHYMLRSDLQNEAYQVRDDENATYDQTAMNFEQVVIIKPQFFP